MWTLILKRMWGAHSRMLPGMHRSSHLSAITPLESSKSNKARRILNVDVCNGRFATEAGKLSLLRVLRAYAVYDTEVGYCQGMNFLAALLLTWMPNEATAFGGLVVLMQQRMLRDLYKSDLAKLQVFCPTGRIHYTFLYLPELNVSCFSRHNFRIHVAVNLRTHTARHAQPLSVHHA